MTLIMAPGSGNTPENGGRPVYSWKDSEHAGMKDDEVTSRQTQPKAYTSLAGVRANLNPNRSGSSNSGAIQ